MDVSEPVFKRKKVNLSGPSISYNPVIKRALPKTEISVNLSNLESDPKPTLAQQVEIEAKTSHEEDLPEYHVLVINADHLMAKELNHQISMQIPGCSIMFAPTLALARLMLQKRKIDLVISSDILPDGSLKELERALEQLEVKPDVLVFGNLKYHQGRALEDANYEMISYKRLNQARTNFLKPRSRSRLLESKISSLGADIRNDLNNPLQEIVAMVFVAQAGSEETQPQIQLALNAIDGAAKLMSDYVNKLETRIKEVVTS